MKNTEKTKTQINLENQTMSQDLRTISKYLGELKFRKSLVGVDEADVWRKIEKLCELYEYALEAERTRADKAQQKLDSIYARARTLQATRNTGSEGSNGGGLL